MLLKIPKIKDKTIKKANSRTLLGSKVHLMEWPQMESYAGFFKVNEVYNSHLYFWFFPSQSKPSEDPVILWLQVRNDFYKSPVNLQRDAQQLSKSIKHFGS